jgi:hypothetical protein
MTDSDRGTRALFAPSPETVSGAASIDFTADIREVDGRPIAKRGRVPGVTPNPRLVRMESQRD